MSEGQKWFPDEIYDPRPELPDSETWVKLLEAAKEWGLKNNDYHLYGHLLFFRVVGTTLKEHEKFGYAMNPDSEEWENSVEGYEGARDRLLMPYRDVLVSLLKKIQHKEGVTT